MPTPVKLTDVAVAKVKEIMATQEMPLDETCLRVGVRGKSCSGPVYSFNLDEEYDPFYDEVLVQDGLTVVHSKQFAEDMEFVVIDYQEVDDKKGFTFKNTNPMALLMSGCGTCGSGCKSE